MYPETTLRSFTQNTSLTETFAGAFTNACLPTALAITFVYSLWRFVLQHQTQPSTGEVVWLGTEHSFPTLEAKVDNWVLNPFQSRFYSQTSQTTVLNFFASSFPYFLLLIKSDTVSQTSLLPTEPRRISTSPPSQPFVPPLEHFT